MPSIRLIAVVAWTCTGWLQPVAAGEAARAARFLAGDPGLAQRVAHGLVARRPLPPDVPAARPGCSQYRLAPPEDPAASQVLEAWQAGLRDPQGAHGWLLGPVTGARAVASGVAERAEGLAAAGEELLVVCFERPVPDWSWRLDHPALWVAPGDMASPARFRRAADGLAVERQAVGRRRRSALRRVEFVGEPPGGPEAGDPRAFELAVAYGREVDRERSRASVSPRTRLERIQAWDATYALWIDKSARWTMDPAFRRWLAGVLDADAAAAVSHLFGRDAEAARGLLASREPPPAPVRRPFSRTSAPRIQLAHDDADPRARELASRIQAALAAEGVDVRRLQQQEAELPGLQLIAHRPALADPILALLETLWPLGARASEEIRSLERAAELPTSELRRRRAAELEAAWIAEATLVPLVRVHAWLVRDARLEGVRLGPFGVLRLERAAWIR
jgi:hypothetical protein